MNVEYIPNPSYFSRIDVLSGDTQEIVPAIDRHLTIIDKSNTNNRAILVNSSGRSFPIFQGEGNLNYHCGCCNLLIADRIWLLSINNVIVQCSKCLSYNEFPALENSNVVIKGIVYLSPGKHSESNPILLNRGTVLLGE